VTPREEVIDRCVGLCEWCGWRPASEVHHRKRRSQGGLDTAANLIALCFVCHGDAHANPQWAFDVGLMVSGHSPDPESHLTRDGSSVELADYRERCYADVKPN
jgi:hypothetical protein